MTSVFPLMGHVPLSLGITALFQHLPDRSVEGLKKLMRCEWHFRETLGGRMARLALPCLEDCAR